MLWSLSKTVGGFIAGAAAGKVTSKIIKEFTTHKVAVQVVDQTGVPIRSGTFSNIPKNPVEKAVLAVGTFVISGAVALAVNKYVVSEIEDIESIVNEIRQNTDSIIDQVEVKE